MTSASSQLVGGLSASARGPLLCKTFSFDVAPFISAFLPEERDHKKIALRAMAPSSLPTF